jgi:hypothetical protein
MFEVPGIIADTFIGQMDYLRHLTNPEVGRKMPYLEIELRADDIDTDALERTIAYLIKRHEGLRTIFPMIDGEIRQVVIPYDQDKFSICRIEVEDMDEFERAKDEAYNGASEKFSDLNNGPLTGFFLFKRWNKDYFFSVLISHMLSDAWTLQLVRNELFDAYRAYVAGEEPRLPSLLFQLRHYCREKNAHIIGNKEQVGFFWKKKLDGFDEMFDVKPFYTGYGIRHGIPSYIEKAAGYSTRKELTKILNRQDGSMFFTGTGNKKLSDLKKLARLNSCSVSAILYASFYILLYTYTRKKNILIAMLVADRLKPEYRNVAGCLLGGAYLPRRMSDTLKVGEMMGEILGELEEAIKNAIYNHELIGLDGHHVRTNCDLYINYIYTGEGAEGIGTTYNEGHRPFPDTYYPIYCRLDEYLDDLSVQWRYNKTLFTPELIEDLVDCHDKILEYLIDNESCIVKDVVAHFNAI